MKRMVGLTLASIVVVVVAVPAFANGATGLTETAGVLVPTGKILTGTNAGVSLVTSTKTGNITCANAVVMAEARLTTNTTSKVVAEEGGKTYTATCATPTGSAVVKNIKIIKLETTGGGTGTISLSFQIELSSGGTVCSYTGTNDSFTYLPDETPSGGRFVVIHEGALSVVPAACGTTAKLDGQYELDTAESTTSVYLM